MKLGIGHGPRFHLNLFGMRCPRWPCVQSTTTSSIGSTSTHSSSLLDNDYTSSWTYVHYQANSSRGGEADANSNHTGSTLNDTELISLINQGREEVEGEGALATAEFEQNRNSNEVRATLPLLNLISGDRHARPDVRTLFPEANNSQLLSRNGGVTGGGLYDQNTDGGHLSSMAECQYVNLPIRRNPEGNRECIPVYTVGRSTSRSTSSHGSSGGRSLTDLFELDTADNSDWATGGDHPYGIPSSLLGGVLLNLDNQFRLSSNAEWQNWSEFLTSAQEPDLGTVAEVQNSCDNMSGDFFGFGSNQNSGEGTSHDTNDASNSMNNDNTTSDNATIHQVGQNNNGRDTLPTFPFPQSGFLNRQFTLPPPPLSNTSSCSSGSGSAGRPHQQEWYFYDPRLVSEQRTERVTLDTSFRGLHNRCVMSSIIQPPAYDEIIQGEVIESGAGVALSVPQAELPPPYTEHSPSEPPPSYDQSFGHTLAFPTFHIGLPVNPLERRLAASLCNAPLIMTAMSTSMPEPDLLTDVNIDELLDGPMDESNQNNHMNNNLPVSENLDRDFTQNDVSIEDANMDDGSDEEILMESCSEEELMGEEEEHDASDEELDSSQFSLRRYPVGFCLGRRPPLRWSRGMAPNRWAPTENWASQ